MKHTEYAKKNKHVYAKSCVFSARRAEGIVIYDDNRRKGRRRHCSEFRHQSGTMVTVPVYTTLGSRTVSFLALYSAVSVVVTVIPATVVAWVPCLTVRRLLAIIRLLDPNHIGLLFVKVSHYSICFF